MIIGHVKMKMLYDLAGRIHPQQHRDEVPDPAVLSVYYGAERNFAYNRFPLWFKRLVDVGTEHQDDRLTKRPLEKEGVEEKAGSGKRRRIVREGKQKDIGSLLGAFG
jgi:hypothetical protein